MLPDNQDPRMLQQLADEAKRITTLIANASVGAKPILPPEQLRLLKIPELILNNGLSLTTESGIRDIVANFALSRQEFFQQFMDPRRNIDDECGYKHEPSRFDYRLMYDTDPIAHRMVSVLPQEAWMVTPELIDDEDPNKKTKFEVAFSEISSQLSPGSYYKDEQQNPIWDYLLRVNILSGIGQFGILLFGLDDGEDMSTPALELDERGNWTGKPSKHRLNYLRVFDESLIQIQRYNQDMNSPRFGQPEMYNLILFDPKDSSSQAGFSLPMTLTRVHWTRCLHVAECLGSSSEVFAYSRLKVPYRRVYDLIKLYSGSAEMYWKGAFPGITFNSDPRLDPNQVTISSTIKTEMENYFNGLQRYLAITGMSAQTLSPTVVDPTPQIKTQIEAICIDTGIPMRIFQGTERGSLASSQDDSTWNDRLSRYQTKYLTPRLIAPFMDRLIGYGVLPPPSSGGFKIKWPDLNALTDAQKAAISVQRIQAITTYLSGQGNQLIQEMDFLTRIMQIPQLEAEQIYANTLDAQQRQAEMEQEQVDDAMDNELDLGPDGKPVAPGEPPEEEPPVPPEGGQPPEGGGAPPPTGNRLVQNTIQKLRNGSYQLVDKSGKILGRFPSKLAAEKYERAYPYVKYKTDVVNLEGDMNFDDADSFEEIDNNSNGNGHGHKHRLLEYLHNSFTGHRGRPGKRGGSLPRGGKGSGGGKGHGGNGKPPGAVLDQIKSKVREKNQSAVKQQRKMEYRKASLTEIKREKKTAPPPGGYNPNVTKIPKGGVTTAARVGIPAMSVPPPPSKIPKLPNLTKRERKVEREFARTFEKDPKGTAAKFLDVVLDSAKKTGGPPTFGTDDAKVLHKAWESKGMSEKQRAKNRATLNTPLHQTANAIAKNSFVMHLDTLKKGDEILVTVGGCGAGKGFALKKIPQAIEMKKRAKAVWDSAGDQNATENPWILKEAKKRGLKVNYLFVNADPRTQWAHPKRGVIKRAGDPTDGRMVDAKVFADSYAVGAKNHHNFHQQNKNNPNASFMFLDASKSRKGIQVVDGVPEKTLKLNRDKLERFAVRTVGKTDAPPHVKRGALMGLRIWSGENI